jgi:hypothetical protein
MNIDASRIGLASEVLPCMIALISSWKINPQKDVAITSPKKMLNHR